MKKSLALIVLMSTVFLTGCAKSVTLTQVESDTLSDYMTNIVLKYEENYDNKLYTLEEIAKIEAEELAREHRFDAVKLKLDNSSKENSEDKALEGKENNDKSGEQSQVENTNTSKDSNKVGLTKTIGSGSFKIDYKNHKVVSSYKGTDSPVEVTAGEGKSLVLVTFDVENSSTKSQVFDLVEESVEYELILSNGDVLKPVTTLLTYDVQFFNMNIKGGATVEGLILFEIDKNMSVKNSSLSVIKNDLSHNVVLK